VCDTLVALRNSTKENCSIFAKNSDREPNEAQLVEIYPRLKHEARTVKCTYIEVPQVKETHTVLICRPFWMWGAEMGVNEHGLVIGNEAVFTKEPYSKTGLTGMDMLRLALERCKSAEEALDLITGLLEKYGQGGNCGFTKEMYYHNSFIIADPKEAWVLETAGKYWVAKKVKNVRSISNALSIKREWDKASPRLIDHAVEKGWCRDDKDFSFAKCYSDLFYTFFAKGRIRQKYTQRKLEEKIGEIDFTYIKKIMRSHYTDLDYTPVRGSMKDICMHAGGTTRPSQTAGSLIVLLYEDLQLSWVTATSTPCISLYKPVFIPAGIPDIGKPKGTYDPQSLWWKHEKLHRKLLSQYRTYAPEIRKEVEELERKLEKLAKELRDKYVKGEASLKELFEVTNTAFDYAYKIIEKYDKIVEKGFILNPFFNYYWRKVNKQALLNI